MGVPPLHLSCEDGCGGGSKAPVTPLGVLMINGRSSPRVQSSVGPVVTGLSGQLFEDDPGGGCDQVL